MITCVASFAVPNNRIIDSKLCLEKHLKNIQLGLCFTITETQEMFHFS